MRCFFTVLAVSMVMAPCAWSQNALNLEADNIIGTYYVAYDGEESKVVFTKEDDGTYKAQTIWVKNCLDENGEVRKDTKNPDKSMRNVPCNRIVLITGLEYNQSKHRWDGGKVYDPTRGIRANATCFFGDDGKFRLKGSLLGFSQTVIWEKISSEVEPVPPAE